MPEIPRRAFVRGAKLAALPVGFAGRTTLGVGKRIGGKPAELVAAEIQARTAEQLFQVLGQLKGGAMKAGQALSVFEAALPEELAGPYRASLTKLQEAGPPMPAATVHKVLAEQLGAGWRSLFSDFSEVPAASASIGQVHKATWADGRTVAVKIQYPGAGPALLGDLKQLSRMARLFSAVTPGLDVKPLLVELRERVAEELDYTLEADAQRAMAEAYVGDPDIVVPGVVAGADKVIVTEWLDGTPLSKIISEGSPSERDRAGLLFVRFLLSGPAKAGLLHADPHPGNFRLLADGRFGALDFGAVNRLPDGLPRPVGELIRLSLAGDAAAVFAGLRADDFIKPDVKVDAQAVLDYLRPMMEPLTRPDFQFSRPWLRAQAVRVGDPRSEANKLGRQLNLPPEYLLVHRVTLGCVGILCQLGAAGDWYGEMSKWVPGLAE